MADRGRPLPFALKEQIKNRTAAGERVKPLARELGMCPKTVRKYKFKRCA